ncbi:hypothetical protein V22_31340 [Calycomorphotria hydatis]|uniref:Uncharacterized protein n=1 Tax=Calycomorphotria hydatis TaxID=2528027 RepID=A0A517TBW9_9PLAN|nr:hypothetical protein V22_31340 [Calycomorphotria hydatis]
MLTGTPAWAQRLLSGSFSAPALGILESIAVSAGFENLTAVREAIERGSGDIYWK